MTWFYTALAFFYQVDDIEFNLFIPDCIFDSKMKPLSVATGVEVILQNEVVFTRANLI